MRRVCAWCGREMGEKPPYDDPSITHSICDECLPKALKSACKPAEASPEFRSNLLERLMSEVEAKWAKEEIKNVLEKERTVE